MIKSVMYWYLKNVGTQVMHTCLTEFTTFISMKKSFSRENAFFISIFKFILTAKLVFIKIFIMFDMQITDMLYVSFAFYHISSEKYVCRPECV